MEAVSEMMTPGLESAEENHVHGLPPKELETMEVFEEAEYS